MPSFFRMIKTLRHGDRLYFDISVLKNEYLSADTVALVHLSTKNLTLKVNKETIETMPIECVKESILQLRDKLPGLINDEEMVSELQPALTFVAGLY